MVNEEGNLDTLCTLASLQSHAALRVDDQNSRDEKLRCWCRYGNEKGCEISRLGGIVFR